MSSTVDHTVKSLVLNTLRVDKKKSDVYFKIEINQEDNNHGYYNTKCRGLL